MLWGLCFLGTYLDFLFRDSVLANPTRESLLYEVGLGLSGITFASVKVFRVFVYDFVLF
jgi:hypothetical protein